jgi:hypothetical protein
MATEGHFRVDADGNPTHIFCASSRAAQALPDEEFWARVMEQGDPGAPWDMIDDGHEFELDLGTYQNQPCRVCGGLGACGYDEEGRPLIHATESSDE